MIFEAFVFRHARGTGSYFALSGAGTRHRLAYRFVIFKAFVIRRKRRVGSYFEMKDDLNRFIGTRCVKAGIEEVRYILVGQITTK